MLTQSLNEQNLLSDWITLFRNRNTMVPEIFVLSVSPVNMTINYESKLVSESTQKMPIWTTLMWRIRGTASVHVFRVATTTYILSEKHIRNHKDNNNKTPRNAVKKSSGNLNICCWITNELFRMLNASSLHIFLLLITLINI